MNIRPPIFQRIYLAIRPEVSENLKEKPVSFSLKMNVFSGEIWQCVNVHMPFFSERCRFVRCTSVYTVVVYAHSWPRIEVHRGAFVVARAPRSIVVVGGPRDLIHDLFRE